MCNVFVMRRTLVAFILALGVSVGGMVVGPAAHAAGSPASAETSFLDRLNATRATNGLDALQRDAGLDNVARNWSASMAGGACGGTGAICHRPGLMAAVAAIDGNAATAGENVAFIGSSDVAGSVDKLSTALEQSPGHLANILGNYNRVGVGLVATADKVFVTFDFMKGPALAPAPAAAPRASDPSGYNPVTPSRLIDTRETGQHLGAGATLRVKAGGRSGIPADAIAVTVNVTTTDAPAAGYLTVWPCGSAQPTVSNLNHGAGETRANLVTTGLDAGDLCIFSQRGGNVIVDAAGWYKPGTGSGYEPSRPSRLLDTRDTGGRVLDAVVTIPGGTAAALNITATDTVGSGFVTAWPCDVARPLASNLNYGAGETNANLAFVRVPGDHRICLHSLVPINVVVDLEGTFGSGGQMVITDPRRAVDTRDGTGGSYGRVIPGQPLVISPRGSNGVGGSARGVALNVTAADPLAAGWLSVYPCAEGLPKASNLNYGPYQVVANADVAKLDGNGQVCVATMVPTDVVIDVTGWLT